MSEGSDLQFDRAEYENAPADAQCAACKRSLTNHYFDVNGSMVCEACRYTIESQQTGGSPVGRFALAFGAGLVAAIAGALLYYAIAAVSGYEFGLIAIVVGWGVGAAVKWGSNARGGWLYQSLAMMLTYVAIVSTYIPPMIEGFRNAAAAQQVQGQQAPAASSASSSSPSGPAESTVAQPAAMTTENETNKGDGPPLVLALLFAVGILLAVPFLAGVENIIGIIIIGIGLYEAWKLNRRQVFTITGPHTISRTSAAPASA